MSVDVVTLSMTGIQSHTGTRRTVTVSTPVLVLCVDTPKTLFFNIINYFTLGVLLLFCKSRNTSTLIFVVKKMSSLFEASISYGIRVE